MCMLLGAPLAVPTFECKIYDLVASIYILIVPFSSRVWLPSLRLLVILYL